jgi:hypothetical protein
VRDRVRRFVLLEQLPQRDQKEDDAGRENQRGNRHLPLHEQAAPQEPSRDGGDRGHDERPPRDLSRGRIVHAAHALRERPEDLQRSEHDEEEREDLAGSEHGVALVVLSGTRRAVHIQRARCTARWLPEASATSFLAGIRTPFVPVGHGIP